MTNRQEAKLNMYSAILSFCNQNPEIMNSIPALQSSFNSFADTVGEIRDVAQKEAQINSGLAKKKNGLRQSLTNRTISIIARVFAYAATNGDDQLRDRAKLSVSNLSRLSDEELYAACMNCIAEVNAMGENLDAFRITPEMLQDLTELANKYRDIAPLPRLAISQRIAYRETLRELFRTATAILKDRMDKIVMELKTSNPGFYLPYTNNRVIVDLPTTPTQLRGTVTHGQTQAPLTGAVISIAENNTLISTGEDGKFAIKPIRPGTYSMQISKQGFQPQTITDLQVKLGQVTAMDVALLPAV